jgi:hypothetical protein
MRVALLLIVAAILPTLAWSGWSRLNATTRLTALSAGGIVLVAFLLNEILVWLIPGPPLWWTIFYFPVRAVGVPIAGVIQALASARDLLAARRAAPRLVAAAGILVAVAVVWFNWTYPRMLFLDRHAL